MIKLNGVEVKPTIFPDKTSQVWGVFTDAQHLKNTPVLEVEWKFEQEAELIHLAQLKMLLDNVCPKAYKSLHIPYLPYARQDKQVSDITTFALSTFARILNQMEWDVVSVIDPHSNVDKLINKVFSISVEGKIEELLNKLEAVPCFPDSGAYLRYPNTGKSAIGYPLIGHKIRDQLTGEITEYVIRGTVNKTVLLVDDLCDGGRTFIEAAKVLYNLGASDVYLYTTHGIYSKGVDVLKEAGIKRVFNYNGEV
jgi:ribose-phosphate pyrophosphokinase